MRGSICLTLSQAGRMQQELLALVCFLHYFSYFLFFSFLFFSFLFFLSSSADYPFLGVSFQALFNGSQNCRTTRVLVLGSLTLYLSSTKDCHKRRRVEISPFFLSFSFLFSSFLHSLSSFILFLFDFSSDLVHHRCFRKSRPCTFALTVHYAATLIVHFAPLHCGEVSSSRPRPPRAHPPRPPSSSRKCWATVPSSPSARVRIHRFSPYSSSLCCWSLLSPSPPRSPSPPLPFLSSFSPLSLLSSLSPLSLLKLSLTAGSDTSSSRVPDGGARRDVTWREVAWRDVAWRGVTWRDETWRGVMWPDCLTD